MDKPWTRNTARAALLGSLVALGGSAGAVATAAEPAAPVPIGINESRCTGEVCSVGACVTQRLFDSTSLPSTVRIVPNLVAGKPHGFKLYAIKPGSLPAQLADNQLPCATRDGADPPIRSGAARCVRFRRAGRAARP